MRPENAIEIQGLTKTFPGKRDWLGRVTGFVHALNGIDLTVRKGEILGIVGESGCGKTTLTQVILGLIPPSSGTVETAATPQIVFQDPQSSLNPRMKVWRVITEPLFATGRYPVATLRDKAEELATAVGLRPEHIDRYPHEFSGGQRQRIATARALASDPETIIFDEPTSALDISVQAQILNLLLELREARDLTFVIISHDISVIRHLADRAVVMYLGQVVEEGPADTVLANPAHPYSQLLLSSVPSVRDGDPQSDISDFGEPPDNQTLPRGCYFAERCIRYEARRCSVPQAIRRLGQTQVRCALAVR